MMLLFLKKQSEVSRGHLLPESIHTSAPRCDIVDFEVLKSGPNCQDLREKAVPSTFSIEWLVWSVSRCVTTLHGNCREFHALLLLSLVTEPNPDDIFLEVQFFSNLSDFFA